MFLPVFSLSALDRSASPCPVGPRWGTLRECLRIAQELASTVIKIKVEATPGGTLFHWKQRWRRPSSGLPSSVVVSQVKGILALGHDDVQG